MQQQLTRTARDEAHAVRQIDTPLGPMLALAGAGGILRLEFDRDAEPDISLTATRAERLEAERHLKKLASELGEYFAGKREQFTVRLLPSGSDFEQRAWRFLCGIPFGQTRSYGEQARSIAGPNAARAVGGANGRNRIAIVIPCHRVIGADGSLTGFASGIDRKRWLLRHEGVQLEDEEPSLFNA
jgi:O-6-methylguanine DNA methyltransferase